MTDRLKNAAHTSNADRVIDAVSEVDRKKPNSYVCNNCGSESFTARKPLGEPLIRICNSCGSKSFKGRFSMAPTLPENVHHKQGFGRGPAVSSLSKQTTRKNDKHTPTYRSKGKINE